MATQILASPAKESDPKPQRRVLIGIDTHKNNHVASAIDYRGGTLAEIIVPACLLGYEALLEWALELAGGVVSGLAFGIEGTNGLLWCWPKSLPDGRRLHGSRHQSD